MILSEKYKEIMDQVRVTDEMKQRVLRNMKEQVEAEKASKLRMNAGNKVRTIRKQKSGERPESGKIIQSRFFSYGRISRYLSAAACIMMLIVGGLTVPRLLHLGNGLPPAPTGAAVGMAPDETMVGLGESESETRQDELGGQAGAMIGNGMVEVDSLAELSQIFGFSVPEVKNIPFEVTSTVYTNGWNVFAQVEYQGKSQDEAVLFRKARGTDDISGDYNTYSDVKEVTVKEVSVTLKGDDGQYKLAIWQQDGFAYSLNYEPGGSEAVFVEMIQSVQ